MIGKYISVLLCLVLILPGLVFGEEKSEQGINKEQPISIGELIYRNEGVSFEDNIKLVSAIHYRYEGCDTNSIKIKISSLFIAGDSYKEGTPEFRTLPLNQNKQALLKVETFDSASPTKELIITVIDEFYRIKVEEYKK